MIGYYRCAQRVYSFVAVLCCNEQNGYSHLIAKATGGTETPLFQVLNLLLDMPNGFPEVLIEHGCLPRILQLVELQLVRQAFQEG